MSKPLSLNEIRTRCAQFALEWRDCPGDERQDAQSFVRDLLRVYGITGTRAALYEKRAKRSSTANQGYIDALVPGQLLVEMKSAGKDLKAAEYQALDYIDDLPDAEQPRYVLTSDFRRFRLLDLEGDEGADTKEWTLTDFAQHAEAMAFLAGYHTRTFGSQEQEQASVEAAKLMAQLYESLDGSGLDDHDAGVFMVRTLFALYADDSGVWERDLFYEFLDSRTSEDGSDLGSQLASLFQILNTPLDRRPKALDELLARFPYVNGGIFAGTMPIPYLDQKFRRQLLQAVMFDWREISPAIFGSLFQAVKSPEARRSLGEHYTTEENILKTLGPLFLDELRERFTEVFHDVAGLKKLRSHLATIRVVDYACGSGNFLIVAYRELRQLELDILLRLQELGDTSSLPTLFFRRQDLAVRLDHVAGVEIEDWPAQIARAALRLVDHQANMAMEAALGKAPDTLPLDTVALVHTGNALRMDWAEVMPPAPGVMVVGNPPFIGQYLRSSDQTADLKHVWGKQYNGYLDYVTGWFKKSVDFFSKTEGGGRFAFVSTNSIAQGHPVGALFSPIFDAGWRIRFAHQTFAWSSEVSGAAAVHCVITGFDREPETPAKLFTYDTPRSQPFQHPVHQQINGYLIDGPLLYADKRMKPLSPLLVEARYGSKAADGGHLIVEQGEEYTQVLADPVASQYLRPFAGSRELIHGLERWCLWMAGDDFSPQDINHSAILKQRVSGVRDMRLASKKKPTRGCAATPHLFQENHQPDCGYVMIPRVFSETRLFATVSHVSAAMIASDSVFTMEDPDGFAFAILSSSMFITWQRAVGGRLESRLRFSNTLVWNNLPLPPVEPKSRDQIIQAGRSILAARALHPERSLADHYNPLAMDPSLLKAHAELDRYVDKAFGAKKPLKSNEERLAVLFDRYVEMTKESPQD